MKINERTLVQVVHSSQTPADMSGWLFKRGEVNRTFQKRWCVLKGNLFYYFDKKTDREPIGVIILEGCRLELAENETELFAFKIDFGGDDQSAGQASAPQMRTYVLGTESQEEMEKWLKALSCASYDFLKMIVAELQAKLDDVNRTNDRRRLRNSAHNPFETIRHNPFDSDGFDLMQTKTSSADPNFIFTRRPFAEIHELYGRQFSNYLKQNKPQEEEPLIVF